MNSLRLSNIVIVSLFLLAYLNLALLGLVSSYNVMSTSGHEGSSSCLLMQEASLCKMNVFDHINAWQSTLLSNITGNSSLALLASLLFVSFIFLNLKKINILFDRLNRLILHFYERLKVEREPNFLTYLFSQGILNPRLS